MNHQHIHKANWIKDLRAANIHHGSNNEPLETLDYHELRRMVSILALRQELVGKAK